MRSSKGVTKSRRQVDPEKAEAFIKGVPGNEEPSSSQKDDKDTLTRKGQVVKKTTIELPENVWTQLKVQSALQQKPLREIFIEAAEDWLQKSL